MQVEQLEQKKEKERYSRLFEIIKPYNGRYFPIFSQGCRVCLSFPFNDNPRLAVVPGDRVVVSHANKRWFYGYKECNDANAYPLKGWFPKQCAVSLMQPSGDRTDEHKKTK